MATHSSIFTWSIPWTEEPRGLRSMGSQRVGHDWETNTPKYFRYILLIIFLCKILLYIYYCTEKAWKFSLNPHLYTLTSVVKAFLFSGSVTSIKGKVKPYILHKFIVFTIYSGSNHWPPGWTSICIDNTSSNIHNIVWLVQSQDLWKVLSLPRVYMS